MTANEVFPCAYYNCINSENHNPGVECILREDDPENDLVNHPKHYTSHPSGVECIEITRHMGFNLGNVIKYVWREGLKGESVSVEDLKKAAWYLRDEIEKRSTNG